MQYRKITEIVEAFQLGIDSAPTWFKVAELEGKVEFIRESMIDIETFEEHKRAITTIFVNVISEGKVINQIKADFQDNHDYIIKDSNGNLSVCKSDIFENTYEKVIDLI